MGRRLAGIINEAVESLVDDLVEPDYAAPTVEEPADPTSGSSKDWEFWESGMTLVLHTWQDTTQAEFQ